MTGVLLDKHTGQVEPPPLLLGPDGVPTVITSNRERGWHTGHGKGSGNTPPVEAFKDRLPDHILDKLKRSSELPAMFQPRASIQSWEETLYATIASDTAVTAAAETAVTPGFVFPAGYFYPGRIIKVTLWGMMSTVITTPGTFIWKLRGGVGGTTGTTLVTSGTYAPDPTAASTQLTTYVEFWTVIRGSGATGATLTLGRMWLSDIDDATVATIVGNLNMHTIPTSAPATVNLDTTATNTWSVTLTPNVATGSYTNLLTIIEAMT